MVKSINLRLEENTIQEIKELGKIYHKNMTELLREAIEKFIQEKKNNVYYRLTANIEECSQEETDEIITALNNLTDEDLEIVEEEVIDNKQTKK